MLYVLNFLASSWLLQKLHENVNSGVWWIFSNQARQKWLIPLYQDLFLQVCWRQWLPVFSRKAGCFLCDWKPCWLKQNKVFLLKETSYYITGIPCAGKPTWSNSLANIAAVSSREKRSSQTFPFDWRPTNNRSSLEISKYSHAHVTISSLKPILLQTFGNFCFLAAT